VAFPIRLNKYFEVTPADISNGLGAMAIEGFAFGGWRVDATNKEFTMFFYGKKNSLGAFYNHRKKRNWMLFKTFGYKSAVDATIKDDIDTSHFHFTLRPGKALLSSFSRGLHYIATKSNDGDSQHAGYSHAIRLMDTRLRNLAKLEISFVVSSRGGARKRKQSR
jgi:hypothetical protein